MKQIIIEKLEAEHPAKTHGFNYNIKISVNGEYCGAGKFCKTLEEVEEQASWSQEAPKEFYRMK